MQYTSIEEIFRTPWGIVEHRRQEIEASAFGGFDKIVAEETDKQFPTARGVAVLMGCGETTARRWLNESDARCIYHTGLMRFYVEDVKNIVSRWKAKEAEREKARLTKIPNNSRA